jgi:hypothetical protein
MTVIPDISGDYGVWNGYRIPADRFAWHPSVGQFFDYWVAIAPPARLPGRQHVAPEQIPRLLSRIWMLDVYRDPLRYRYRLCGTEMVRSLGREVTGTWLDEVHPELIANPEPRDRLRFAVEQAAATWRRGPPLWMRDRRHRTIETCIVPLAADGVTVDKLLAFSVLFDANGRPT